MPKTGLGSNAGTGEMNRFLADFVGFYSEISRPCVTGPEFEDLMPATIDPEADVSRRLKTAVAAAPEGRERYD